MPLQYWREYRTYFHIAQDWQVSESTICRIVHSLEDSGYQGISKLHKNSPLPKKKPKGGKLTRQDKRSNRILARRRVVVEHINRRLKVFRILSQPYRNRGKRFGLRCHLIAGLYNYELQNAA